MILFGAPLYCLYGRRADIDARTPRSLLLWTALLGWIGALVWIVAQTGEMADSIAAAVDPSTLYSAVFETHVGMVWLIRLGVLLLVTSLAFSKTPRYGAQAAAGGVLAASLALHGHAGASLDDGVLGPASIDAAHALTAGVWIGALLMLVLQALSASPARAEDGAALRYGLDRFSAIGPIVVTILIITGLINVWFAVGSKGVPVLLETSYGVVLATKIGLLVIMLALAGLHRFTLAPRLARALMGSRDTQTELRALRQSLIAEAVLGGFVLIAAALLGSLPPPEVLQ